MKTTFSILANRPKLRMRLTRDSVCAGDDCNAPHEKETEVYSFSDPVASASTLSSSYLPSVSGSKHIWICNLNGVNIAEIKTSGIKPLVKETPLKNENAIHFTYISSH
jgi:hypothetical protein